MLVQWFLEGERGYGGGGVLEFVVVSSIVATYCDAMNTELDTGEEQEMVLFTAFALNADSLANGGATIHSVRICRRSKLKLRRDIALTRCYGDNSSSKDNQSNEAERRTCAVY